MRPSRTGCWEIRCTYFNSRTSCEVRLAAERIDAIIAFQLTHLLRGATFTDADMTDASENFNSRTSCEVRPMATLPLHLYRVISTHAPLARCDGEDLAGRRSGINFNSRTSCEVRRRCVDGYGDGIKFQLTHLLRGATAVPFRAFGDPDFNSRTSCEVRHHGGKPLAVWRNFNSRTSCEVRQKGPDRRI